MDPMKPDPTVLTKLGSIVVHAKEMFSSGGHEFDKVALQGLLNEVDILRWLDGMDRLALLPIMRNRHEP